MDSATIRERFMSFFEARDHVRVPSSSLVANDPTLLLTNAGMNQFKPYFLGEQTPPYRRAVSAQRCFRTPDIEEVGRTARHLTFFEMLGNFSFGEYYKEKACPWAWELVTEGYGIDPERLWVSIFTTDDEAHDVWVDVVGVRPERIVRLGREDNFWAMGVAGPCGPDSEIFVDLGDRFGEASPNGPGDNPDRYLEIWNLVFMQNECDDAIEPVGDLPTRNIDTGSGLERVALVLQGVSSVFETDVLGGMVRRAGELVGRTYGDDDRTDMGLRILADHGRGMTWLIFDGVLPSNEKRGYVLRRVMRRAVRHARLLGREEPVLPELVAATVELMGPSFPDLRERADFIAEVAAREEERFATALKQGLGLLEGDIERARASRSSALPGEVAFRLHDTFGFPIELTREIASDAGLSLDEARFGELMSEQREQARRARRTEGRSATGLVAPVLERHGTTEFVGYEHLDAEGHVLALIDGTRSVERASEGDEIDLVLDRTAFYAEGGGQVGDRGRIESRSAALEVLDTRALAPGLTGHRAVVRAGEISVGDDVSQLVDPGWRAGAQRAHTATHILHWALRDRLGEHATQAGSLVEPGRLRFDFNHFEALGRGRLAELADELQERVLQDDGVRAYETSFDTARSIGAMAIFGEKYGDFVRVVEVGDYSKELCGGTHVLRTGQVGAIVLTSEGSIGANLRRVEALVGQEGMEHLRRRAAQLERVAETLRATPDEVAERVERLVAGAKDMERRLAEVERKSTEADAARLASAAVEVDGTRLVVARRDIGVDALRSLAQKLKGRLGSAVVVLGAAGEGRANLVGAVTRDLAERGISARELLAPGARLLGGGAGGKPELAVSGGPASDKLEEAIEAVARVARDALTT
ncbi:MAG TPA: alanine--tRNA ligase [Actinomycetota bacterium]|nr:alanine--tRNA ligase [Actinomycetota bacterium]